MGCSKKNCPSKRANPLVSVYMEKFLFRQVRSRLFQAGQPICPYKRNGILIIKYIMQRDLAKWAIPVSGPARLPYKQPLTWVSREHNIIMLYTKSIIKFVITKIQCIIYCYKHVIIMFLCLKQFVVVLP